MSTSVCGFQWQPDPCSREQQLARQDRPIPTAEETEPGVYRDVKLVAVGFFVGFF